MCGRFYVAEDGSDAELEEILREAGRRSGEPPKTGEVFPTDHAAVLSLNRLREPAAFSMRWGFSSASGGRPLINARAETADALPAFRESFATRRCLVPASNWFEWEQTDVGKRKRTLRPDTPGLFFLAGLYRLSPDGSAAFVVLTRPALGEAARIHPRMPVVLPPSCKNLWLSPNADPKDCLRLALPGRAD